jgi:hypothetical protein
MPDEGQLELPGEETTDASVFGRKKKRTKKVTPSKRIIEVEEPAVDPVAKLNVVPDNYIMAADMPKEDPATGKKIEKISKWLVKQGKKKAYLWEVKAARKPASDKRVYEPREVIASGETAAIAKYVESYDIKGNTHQFRFTAEKVSDSAVRM